MKEKYEPNIGHLLVERHNGAEELYLVTGVTEEDGYCWFDLYHFVSQEMDILGCAWAEHGGSHDLKYIFLTGPNAS